MLDITNQTKKFFIYLIHKNVQQRNVHQRDAIPTKTKMKLKIIRMDNFITPKEISKLIFVSHNWR